MTPFDLGSAVVHIVDDDPAIRDALSWLFSSRGIGAREWDSAEAFLAALPLPACSCVLLDVRMTGLSGPEAFERLRAAGCDAPVIFLTGHANVPVAVQALKTGAFDFVEKPFNDNQIVDLALAALAKHADGRAERRERHEMIARRDALSPREREVLILMLQGLMNKEIADRLEIAMRTVEVHRARVLTKMNARNAIDLAAQFAAARIAPDPPTTLNPAP